VLGPTASGKTRLACTIACHLNGEIISADSRQVYKHLNIGTGKDLHEFTINGKSIPYHLIDIIDPSEQFYLHQFAEALHTAFVSIISKDKLPVICGGSGLYLDALQKDLSFTQIKENEELRKQLENFSKEELVARLNIYPSHLTETVDLNSKKRIIRGIEIADYRSKNPDVLKKKELPYKPFYIGIDPGIEARKELISTRLLKRIDEGLIEEVKELLKKGITSARLELFGLEYKFVVYYLQNKISKADLVSQLQTAIFQFAKRQMTWFRKMEKEGIKIHWMGRGSDVPSLLEILKNNFNI
jgi:tRNA dimethylallyltransferase